ncbi:hypothetical protein [Aquimarina sp. I32.4]|uniref:hypothetical protein n=1 Tax=Aquimarina sp. I32.4 TaxID=2053903 RepID=UPI000CDEFEE7|nr:hypothetical protein [Aquimarina sp. I32.4]
MKQKTYLSILVIIIVQSIYAQSLKNILWNSVNPCYSELTYDLEENEQIINGEVIDDSKNGYLKVSGTFSTCGCNCTSTAGAYKQKNATYTVLTIEEWGCSWKKKLSSNKSLQQILPKELMIKSFIPSYDFKKYNQKYAIFYLQIDIPKIGTDTNASLQLIPYGVNYEATNILTYSYTENNKTTDNSIVIQQIANTIEDKQTLQYILNKQYEKITDKDKNLITNTINQDNDFLKSVTYLNKLITQVHTIYTMYQLVKYDTIILGWDRNKSKFYIKEKVARSSTISFNEFILTKLTWWQALC